MQRPNLRTLKLQVARELINLNQLARECKGMISIELKNFRAMICGAIRKGRPLEVIEVYRERRDELGRDFWGALLTDEVAYASKWIAQRYRTRMDILDALANAQMYCEEQSVTPPLIFGKDGWSYITQATQEAMMKKAIDQLVARKELATDERLPKIQNKLRAHLLKESRR